MVSPPPFGGMISWYSTLYIGGTSAQLWSECHSSPETRFEFRSKYCLRMAGWPGTSFDAVPLPPTWICGSPK